MDEFPVIFEDVATDSGFTVKRLRVPGGWLVTVDNGTTLQVVVIPDPIHQWPLTS